MSKGNEAQKIYKIHSELAENFMFGIDAKTKKRLGESYELKNKDVIKIITSKK